MGAIERLHVPTVCSPKIDLTKMYFIFVSRPTYIQHKLNLIHYNHNVNHNVNVSCILLLTVADWALTKWGPGYKGGPQSSSHALIVKGFKYEQCCVCNTYCIMFVIFLSKQYSKTKPLKYTW